MPQLKSSQLAVHVGERGAGSDRNTTGDMNASSAVGSTSKPAYDPVKALEGMFKGAVIRVAQSLRDPKNYGASTSIVLPEVTKRFHDAIDDIEIQLLEAKWDLEARLAANRAARASEQAATTAETETAKRKRAEEDNNDKMKEEASVKRVKVEETETAVAEKASVPQLNADGTDSQRARRSLGSEETQPLVTSIANELSQPNNNKIHQISQQSSATPAQTSASEDTKTNLPPNKPPDKPQVTLEAGHNKQVEGVHNGGERSIEHDDEFESMFDIPTGDAFDHNPDNNTLESSNTQNESSLNTLLPGLGDYAKQAPDETSSAHLGGQNPAVVVGPRPDSVGSLGNDFDLPDFGGPNEFDDLLNDAFDLGDSTNDGHNMMSSTFDDLFGDGQ